MKFNEDVTVIGHMMNLQTSIDGTRKLSVEGQHISYNDYLKIKDEMKEVLYRAEQKILAIRGRYKL